MSMTRKTRARALLTVVALAALLAVPARAAQEEKSMEGPALELVTLESPNSPIVAVRLLFRVGSIHDPEGKEGLAALTALMIGEAGTAERSYRDLVDALYPMAADISVNTDREVTVIAGEVHRDKLDEYVALLAEAVLEPGFAKSDFERNKEQLSSYLTTTLRATNDELLGLETIQQEIFEGHPYGHSPAGTVQGLESITLGDVKKFYRRHFTRANLMLGLAGGYPEGFEKKLAGIFGKLPAGEPEQTELPGPPEIDGRSFTLVEKKTGSVGIHLGYPLPIERSDPDYYPLMLANSFLGEHRTHHGVLMQQLRGERGLNYGDYSYIEYWESPPFTTSPSPNVPRHQQYFSVWVRPVVPETAHFALRAALYYVDQVIEQGLSEEEFELTRTFLTNYSKLWAQTLGDRLGFLMDSRYYGMDYYIDEIEERLAALSVEEVNAAIRKYISTEAYDAVVVTDNAAALKEKIAAEKPSPISYDSEVDEAVLADDETIREYPVEATSFEIVPVEEMFEE